LILAERASVPPTNRRARHTLYCCMIAVLVQEAVVLQEELRRRVIAIAKSFFRSGKPYNPPGPPLKKGGNYKELLLKSPFEKGGLRGNLRTSKRKELWQTL
jgi:hypothetical protein